MTTTVQEEGLAYRLVKGLWIGAIIVVPLIIAGPALQQANAPVSQTGPAVILAILVALHLYFLGFTCRRLYQKRFAMASIGLILFILLLLVESAIRR